MDLPSNLPSNLPFRCLCINSYPKQLIMTSGEINPAAWGEIFPCSYYFLYIFLMTLLLPLMFFCFALFSPFSPSCEPKTGCGMWFHVLHTLPTMTHIRRSTINECEVTFLRLWRHSLLTKSWFNVWTDVLNVIFIKRYFNQILISWRLLKLFPSKVCFNSSISAFRIL